MIQELKEEIKQGRKKLLDREIELWSPEFYEIAYKEIELKSYEDMKKEVLKLINKKQVEYNNHKDLEELKREVEKL